MTKAAQFDLDDGEAYRTWRARKLADHPRDIGELLVRVDDPRALTAAERAALIGRCAAPTWPSTPAAAATIRTRKSRASWAGRSAC